VAKEEVEQTDEQAPVAPTLDRKFLKGTPEHKAYKASKVRQKYRFVWNKTGAKKIRVPVKEETQKGKNVVPPHVGALATGGIVKEEENENKPLGKVMRAGDGKKKFKVFVKNANGNVVKVGFGDPNMEINNCDTATDRTTPRYWSCKMWTKKPVSDITK